MFCVDQNQYETVPHVLSLFINTYSLNIQMKINSAIPTIAKDTQSRLTRVNTSSESRLISFLFQLADHVTDETIDLAKDVCPGSPLKRTVDDMRDANWANAVECCFLANSFTKCAVSKLTRSARLEMEVRAFCKVDVCSKLVASMICFSGCQSFQLFTTAGCLCLDSCALVMHSPSP